MNLRSKKINKLKLNSSGFQYYDVKEKVIEFNKYDISYYPGKWPCDVCDENKILIYYKKNKGRYCKHCLSKKIFGDFRE